MNTSSISQDTNEIDQALDTIVNVLSEKVAAKVAAKVGSETSVEGVQNGFNSVAEAANKMSGGKKKKSRKFCLTNKSKSRKQKK